MLDLVAKLYRAEHAADERLVGAAKLEFRKQRAGPIRVRMRAWLDAHRERHPSAGRAAADDCLHTVDVAKKIVADVRY